MRNFILNSAQTLPENGTTKVQIAPFGEFKGVMNMPKGKTKPFVQHLDKAAFERILTAWNAKGSPELLVDADHGSCNQDGSTRAFAWASNLRIEDDGLYADFKFTEEGAKAVNAREYRFVSPVFDVGENGAILGLDSIALTNRPNLPVSCVLNCSESGVINVEDKKETPEMDELKTMLGLAADATPEDVAAAVKALQKKVADAEAAALNSEAEKCADENKDKIENRQAFVDLYVKNGKETALAFLSALKSPVAPNAAPSDKRISANSAQAPKTTVPAGDEHAKITARNSAVTAYRAAHKCSFQDAWAACRAADPETFAD